MSFNDVVELTATACLIRGIFRKETYSKTRAIGNVAAHGISNPVGQGVAAGFVEYAAVPAVAIVEGARGFVNDVEDLYNWIAK